jgi:predicted metal-dependent hydrolase
MSQPDEQTFHSTRVIRSARRRKTVAARVQDGVLTIYLPARISEEEARSWVERMTRRMSARVQRDNLNDEKDLQRRAARLNRKYFGGELRYNSIVYVTNQTSKYGSCSPGSRRIRISHRMASMPAFVLDYIIVHELAHLIEANHGRRFWKLVNRYPHAERAIGYLMGVGLVPAQERVSEPSLFVPPLDEDDFEPLLSRSRG